MVMDVPTLHIGMLGWVIQLGSHGRTALFHQAHLPRCVAAMSSRHPGPRLIDWAEPR
jgi:hypothetical protein